MKLDLNIKSQPSYECLPTSLAAVLSFYGQDVTISEISENISINSPKLNDWIYNAGIFALKKGFSVKVQTLVPYLFDPSWSKLSSVELIEKLSKESAYFCKWKKHIENQPKQEGVIYDNHFWINIYQSGAEAAKKFLQKGGDIDLIPISKKRIKKHLDSGCPVIFSHNPVILHKMKRAFNFKPDDIRGFSWGHVSVLCGYDEKLNKYFIADPEGDFYEKKMKYAVDQDLVLESILRYNGELLIIGEDDRKR